MKPVVIYTKNTCGYCQAAKELLRRKKVSFDEIEITGDSTARQTMIGRSGGRTTVPQIFIDGQHVGGCDDLYDLEHSGRLDPMLA